MGNLKVSAIIIFFNEERFLGEAIDSVLAQTYNNWELILVNDGSSDDSPAIAQRAAQAHPDRVRYVTHPDGENRGMSASRNRGLEVATGELVAFLDGDDVWLPTKLENQVAELADHPEAAMVAGPLLRWLRWSGNPEAANHEDLMGVGPKKHGRHRYANQLVPAPKLVPLILSDDYYNPAGALIRREALDAVGGFVDEFAASHEDIVAMTKICLTNPVFISTDVTYLYRIHPQSFTQVASDYSDVIEARATFLNWAAGYFERNDVRDPQILRALRRAQLPLRHPRLHWVLDTTRRRKGMISLGRKVGRQLIPRSVRDRLRQRWRDRVRPPRIDAVDDR